MDTCFLHDAHVRPTGTGPRSMHSGPQGKTGPCVQREPTGRAIIVIVIENRKRADKRRERERKKEIETNREREREEQKETVCPRRARVCIQLLHVSPSDGTHRGVLDVHMVSVLDVHTSHSTQKQHTTQIWQRTLHNAPDHNTRTHCTQTKHYDWMRGRGISEQKEMRERRDREREICDERRERHLSAERDERDELVAILAQVVVGNPRRLEPRWKSRQARVAGFWRRPHCRFGAHCWRPSCVFLHEDSYQRRRVCRALAQFWAEERLPERIVEQTVDFDGDVREELVDSVQITPHELVWCLFEEVDDFPVPQFVEENLRP